MNNSPFKRGLVYLLLAVLLAGGVILATRILLGDAFNKEEAQHALYGMWIARDVKALDLGSFWHDTQRQLNWPFLHSWFLSLFFLVFGAGYTSARLLSLLFFLLAAVLIYYLADTLSEAIGWKVGLVAGLLAITSPLMVRFASENTLEGLGAVLFLASAYLYTVCEERKDLLHYILLTILFGLALYTNYIYAYFIVVSYIVVTISKLGPLFAEAYTLERKGEHAAIHFIWWAYRKLIVLGVLLLIIAFWFSVSFARKFMMLINGIFKYSGGTEVKSIWEGLFYYPKVIITDVSFSPWIGLFLLISLFIPFIAKRYRGLNRIYVYTWTPLLLATLTIPAKLPQMIYIIIPFILLIFAAALFYFIDEGKKWNGQLAKVILIVCLIPTVLSLPRAYGLFFPGWGGENMRQVLEYFHATIPKQAEVVSTVNLQHFNPESVQFHFRDWEAPVIADTQLPDEELLGGAAPRYYLTLTLDEGSPYQKDVTDDSLFSSNSWLQGKELAGEVRLSSTRRFESIGVTAKIYEKVAKPTP